MKLPIVPLMHELTRFSFAIFPEFRQLVTARSNLIPLGLLLAMSRPTQRSANMTPVACGNPAKNLLCLSFSSVGCRFESFATHHEKA